MRASGWWAAAIFAASLGGAAPLHAEEASEPPPVPITTADLKGVSTPSPDDLANSGVGGGRRQGKEVASRGHGPA